MDRAAEANYREWARSLTPNELDINLGCERRHLEYLNWDGSAYTDAARTRDQIAILEEVQREREAMRRRK